MIRNLSYMKYREIGIVMSEIYDVVMNVQKCVRFFRYCWSEGL